MQRPVGPMIGVVIWLSLSVAVSQELSKDDLEFFRWRVASWRDAYCERDRHVDNQAFDADRWRTGTPEVRGAMARDLLCGTAAYGLTRAETISLLGPGDPIAEAGAPEWAPVYRIRRTRAFRRYELPAPAGFRVLSHTYDVRVVFDPETETVIWFDVLPAFEADR